MTELQNENTTLSNETEQWLSETHSNHPQIDLLPLKAACELAERISQDKKLPYAESAISQGRNMANELFSLNCDSETLVSAICYPAVYYCQPKKEIIKKSLNSQVEKLLSGAQKMEAIHSIKSSNADFTQQQNTADNLRKMLLAMVDDVRIVLIKLAERLAILKYLKHCPKIQQLAMATQAMSLYAPLANRLGIGQVKWQMEDLAFRYINPEEYAKISKALNMRRKDREEFIQDMLQRLNELFKDSGLIDINITGRAKHIYSIHRKLTRKRVGIEEIYDTSALRILVPSIKDCYTALSIVHATWPHIAKEFDDYIAKPKPNGYRSIHTAVMSPNEINVEIQIRTHKMHEEAELGVAAHWKYKEGSGQTASTYEEKIDLLREVMDWQKEVSTEGPSENLYASIFDDRIYVFTPNGDVFDLIAGATPLDFAYHVHSEVGNRCKGAKVNDTLVPLTHQLKTGDRVSILTSKSGHPSRDWLNPSLGYLKTNAARAKVRHWFRKENFECNLLDGQAIWEKAARRANLTKSAIAQVYKRFNFKKVEDLFASLGAGDISTATIVHQIHSLTKKAQPQEPVIEVNKPSPASSKSSSSKSNLIIEGVDDLLTQLARCCRPIPGDNIIGYITKGRGVSIHQINCSNIQQAINFRPERIIEVAWSTEKPQAYPVDLTIEASDRAGLVRDVSNVIANENLPILGINTRVNKMNNEAYISLTIEIKSLEPLNKIFAQLRQVAGVTRVSRR